MARCIQAGLGFLGFVRTLSCTCAQMQSHGSCSNLSETLKEILLLWSTAGCLRYNVSSLRAVVRFLMYLLASRELQQTPAARYMCTLTRALKLLTLYCMRPAVHNKSLSWSHLLPICKAVVYKLDSGQGFLLHGVFAFFLETFWSPVHILLRHRTSCQHTAMTYSNMMCKHCGKIS